MKYQRLSNGFLWLFAGVCATGTLWGAEGAVAKEIAPPRIRLVRIDYEPKPGARGNAPRWDGLGSVPSYTRLEDSVDFAALRAMVAKENWAMVAAIFSQWTIPVMLKQVGKWKEVDMKAEGFGATASREEGDETIVTLKFSYRGKEMDMELWDGQGALVAAPDRGSRSGMKLYLFELEPTPELQARDYETVVPPVPSLPAAR